jgi:hypothetical protein
MHESYRTPAGFGWLITAIPDGSGDIVAQGQSTRSRLLSFNGSGLCTGFMHMVVH